MEAVPSGSFLQEFSLLAERACTEGARFIIQRPNGRNVVLLSMEDYNALQRELYQAKKEAAEGRHI